MTLPERHDIQIDQGATFKYWFAVEVDGVVQNLATLGYTIGRLTIKDHYGDDSIVVVQLTTANGGVVISYETSADGLQNSGYWYMSPAATAALEDWGDGVHDFEIDNGSDVIRGLDGTATLNPEAST